MRLGMRPYIPILWCIPVEDPLEADATIVVLEGWYIHHLIFLQGKPTPTRTHTYGPRIKDIKVFIYRSLCH